MKISQLNDVEKVLLFMELFAGRTDVYGTYNSEGKNWQVKERVDEKVIHAHLCGHRPFGLYPLRGKYSKVLAIDFDHEPLEVAVECVVKFNEIGVQSYIEVSKSKGYHVWVFFSEFVIAANIRRIAKKVLNDIGKGNAEIFPKQDELTQDNIWGNYINSPLFGSKVLEGRTVFLDFDNMPNPCEDQWSFLSGVVTHNSSFLRGLLSSLNLADSTDRKLLSDRSDNRFGLVPCMKTILKNGVNSNQRVTCYRLAIRLKQMGIPFDIALAALNAWALKNKPIEGKRIITSKEIEDQTTCGYQCNITGFGCSDPAVSIYCDEKCPVYKIKRGNNE